MKKLGLLPAIGILAWVIGTTIVDREQNKRLSALENRESIIQCAANEGFAFGYMAANGWTNYTETTLSNSVHRTLANNPLPKQKVTK